MPYKIFWGFIKIMFNNLLNNIHFSFLFFILLFSQSVQASETLTIWSSHQNHEFLAAMSNKFQEKHDVKISIVQLDPSEIKAEIILSAQDNVFPDLVVIPSDFLGLHKMMNLWPIPDDWYKEKLNQMVRSTVKSKSKCWGVPLIQGNFLLLYYNKKYVSHPATDFDDILLQKKTFLAKNIMPMGWNYNDMYYLMPFLSAFNGKPIEDGKITLNTPAMINALKYYRFLAQQNIVNPECDYRCSQDDFVEGKSAYAINGDWAYRDLKNVLGDDLGVAVLPKINGHRMHPMSSTFVLAIPNYERHSKQKQQLIKAFSEFVQQPSSQQLVYEKTDLLPVSMAYYKQLKQNASGDHKILFRQMALTTPMSSSLNMSIAWQAMAIGFQRYQAGATAEYSAQHMQKMAIEQMNQLDEN